MFMYSVTASIVSERIDYMCLMTVSTAKREE